MKITIIIKTCTLGPVPSKQLQQNLTQGLPYSAGGREKATTALLPQGPRSPGGGRSSHPLLLHGLRASSPALGPAFFLLCH